MVTRKKANTPPVASSKPLPAAAPRARRRSVTAGDVPPVLTPPAIESFTVSGAVDGAQVDQIDEADTGDLLRPDEARAEHIAHDHVEEGQEDHDPEEDRDQDLDPSEQLVHCICHIDPLMNAGVLRPRVAAEPAGCVRLT